MKTKFAKILAVFVAVGGLAFAGFAIATTFGGPDWREMLQEDYFHDYTITQGAAPDYIWTAIRVSDETQVVSSTRLPEVLVKVMDDILQREQAILTELTDREPQLTQRVEFLEKSKADDEAALVKYDAAQKERLATTRQEIEKTAAAVIAATNEAQRLENIIALRREDVIAQTRQVEQLQADEFRLGQQKKNLESLIIQVQGDQQRADLRLKGLQKQAP